MVGHARLLLRGALVTVALVASVGCQGDDASSVAPSPAAAASAAGGASAGAAASGLASTPATPAAPTTQSATPTAAPAIRPPSRVATPAPARTTAAARPATAPSTCGAPANPWGYNFCEHGGYVTDPAAAFCQYFACIASFWENTAGYVMQCDDLTFSHSGGRSGSCSHHDGNYRPLYG